MILTIGELKDLPQLVLACGCFDVITVGHVRHLKIAKSMGGILCVLVTADRFVGKPNRPIFLESTRAEVVDSLRCVDYTVINQTPTAVEAIRLLQPSVYVKGGEYKERPTLPLCAEKAAVESVGGRLEFTGEIEAHTTDTLRKLGI